MAAPSAIKLKLADFSNTWAVLIKPGSSNALAISWIPIGRPNLSKPTGNDIPGRPAKLAGTVKISFKYIVNGSCFLPNSKDVVGVDGTVETVGVGVIISDVVNVDAEASVEYS